MKLKQIRFINHYLFGNTVLDFVDQHGNIYDTVLICGENGSGKTKLLECMFNLFKIPPKDYEVTVYLETSDFTMINKNITTSSNMDYQNEIINGLLNEVIVMKSPNGDYWKVKFNNDQEQSHEFGWDPNNNNHPIQYFLNNIKFKIKKNDKEPAIKTVTTITNLSLDKEEERNNSQVFAGDLNITQLLVDLQAQDADEFFNNSEGKTLIHDINYGKRLHRLKQAFNNFFLGSVELLKVRNFDIQFRNNGGKQFDINGLSSGEKSIIQYGGFFLKNKNLDEITVSFLDEPEQSLHPLWEERILSFYQDILTLNGNRISQLFCITHSEHVVKNALELGCLILIMRRQFDGTFEIIKTTQMNTFPYSPTYSEIKFHAFNLVTNDFHEELYGYLSERERKKVKALDSFFYTSGAPMKSWIGKELDRSGRIINSVRNNTDTLCSYIRNYTHHPELRDVDNPSFSKTELEQSVNFMISLL
jgi:predicted ATPase